MHLPSKDSILKYDYIKNINLPVNYKFQGYILCHGGVSSSNPEVPQRPLYFAEFIPLYFAEYIALMNIELPFDYSCGAVIFKTSRYFLGLLLEPDFFRSKILNSLSLTSISIFVI